MTDVRSKSNRYWVQIEAHDGRNAHTQLDLVMVDKVDVIRDISGVVDTVVVSYAGCMAPIKYTGKRAQTFWTVWSRYLGGLISPENPDGQLHFIEEKAAPSLLHIAGDISKSVSKGS